MIARILDPARDEIAEAAAYYEGREEGVGDRFIRAVKAIVEDIAAHPNR